MVALLSSEQNRVKDYLSNSEFLFEILKMTVEDVSQEDCDLKMKIIFLLKDPENSHLNTAILNKGLSAITFR